MRMRERLQSAILQNKEQTFVHSYTFLDLHRFASEIAELLTTLECSHLLIFGNKTFASYASVLASVYADTTFTPINLELPNEKIFHIAKLTDAQTLILSKEGVEKFNAISNKLPPMDILYLEDEAIAKIEKRKKAIQKKSTTNEFVYTLFTSGSTGVPKGVPISKHNLTSYLDFVIKKFAFTKEDRLSQTFDLSFDLAMHDIFVSFLTGATLFPLRKSDLLMPYKFIKKHKLTVWFSVPSVAAYMDKLGVLNKKIDLRLSLFCGEALPTHLAKKWQTFSNSKLFNLYGPTEATIAISYYPYNDAIDAKVMPIGKIFEGNEYTIEDGELCLSGAQVFSGYLKNEKANKESFLYKNAKRYYKTGDLVELKDGILYYLGRKNFEVKVNGYRIDILEIEYTLKERFGTNCVCVPHTKEKMVQKLILFTEKIVDIADIKHYIPPYIQLEQKEVDAIQLNQNGKVDRKYYITKVRNES